MVTVTITKKGRNTGKVSGVMNMFITLIWGMVSWMHIYVYVCQVIYIKHMQYFLYQLLLNNLDAQMFSTTVKILLKIPASHLECLSSSPTSTPNSGFLITCTTGGNSDSSGRWVTATHRETNDQLPISWLQPGPVLTIACILGVLEYRSSLFFSLLISHPSFLAALPKKKNKYILHEI